MVWVVIRSSALIILMNGKSCRPLRLSQVRSKFPFALRIQQIVKLAKFQFYTLDASGRTQSSFESLKLTVCGSRLVINISARMRMVSRFR